MASSPDRPALSFGSLVAHGLRFHRRIHATVALAVMAAGAVLTGALLVGDSMRGSLRHLLLDQLGSIDEVLVTDRFFQAGLADELQSQPRFKEFFSQAVPAIYVPSTVENPRAGGALRAGNVAVIGCDERFWSLGSGGPPRTPARGEIVLNAPLAEEIGAQMNDEVLVRVGSVSQIPPDSALGRKIETVRTRRLKVLAIIAAEGLGRFALYPNQQLPRNAFVATATLQEALEQPDRVNAIFVAGTSAEDTSSEAHDVLQSCLRPTLADFGIQVELHKLGYGQCTSNRMLLEPATVAAIHQAFADYHPQGVFTYLANTIASGVHEIPYSTITAIDFAEDPPLGPFKSRDGSAIEPLRDDEIVLNTWAAEDLGVAPDARIEITYFEPESTHGQVREKKATFRLKAIAAIEGLAADPDLTPQMPGVTDQVAIGDWDPPFPFDAARVRPVDEKYWDEHRTTPKAFISLAAGRRLWSSRFGETTAVRFVPPGRSSAEALSAQLTFDPPAMGFEFLPLRQLGLKAAAGTTSFDGLFLGFSFFIMVSALLLVALLFRLGVEQRAQEVGILRAVGLRDRQVALVLGSEALIVAAAGSLLGAVAGMIYAWLMLVGLSTWWLGATRTPFLRLYVTPQSILIGLASTVLVSMVTIVWVLWRMDRVAVRRLLAGQTVDDPRPSAGSAGASRLAAAALIVVAGALGWGATWLGGEAQAGAFVGSGALVLAAGLTWIWSRLRRGATASLTGQARLPIARLAMRSGARNPTRSTMTVGLIAAASFLIVALSAFRLDPDREGRGRSSGSGGFDLVGQSDQPIYQDLGSQAGRAELGIPATADKLLAGCSVVPLRVRRGDDASCLNLYQATQPRVLGVGASLVDRGGFAWATTAADSPDEEENPWLLLDEHLPDDVDGTRLLPAVLDYNTATYSLHKELGETIDIDDDQGRTMRLKIVGLLANSIFQGDVLIAESAFLESFPRVSGYRFFLVDTQSQPSQQVQQALEISLGDYGFDAESSAERLAAFFAVQNTYLSTFQSLGGLGLLLGTFGLASVQLRSVLQRRGELALLRATGFRRALLARLVMIENALLLLGGLAVGVAAALVAVLPHWLSGGATVPWLSLALTLALVLIVGLTAGLLAVRATLRAPLLPALREE